MELGQLRFVVDENTLAVGKVMQQLRIATVTLVLPAPPKESADPAAQRLRRH